MHENYTFKPDEVLEYLRKSRSDESTLTVEEVLSKTTASSKRVWPFIKNKICAEKEILDSKKTAPL